MFGFAETGSASISPAGGFGIFTLTTLIGLLVTARAWMSESSYRTLTSTVAGPCNLIRTGAARRVKCDGR